MNFAGTKRVIAFFLLANGLASGCSDDPTGPGIPPVVTPIVWNQIRGGLGVGEIRSIWGTSRQDVRVVHANGILRYDGSAWRAETLPPTLPALNAVWGPAQGAPFAAGDAGTLLRWNSGRWNTLASPTALDIRDLHGRSASDVYAIASNATPDDIAALLHFDGVAWSLIDTRDGADGNAVFAAGGVVFVACNAGVMLRHDGTTWYEDDTFITEDLLDVWAASDDDAIAVGESGHILHWDGSAWSPMNSGVAARLRAVSGSSSTDVAACGDGGTMLHYDGTAWSPTPAGTRTSLTAVYLFPGTDRVAAGDVGTVLFGTGTQWAPRLLGQPFAFEGVWSISDYFMAVGTVPGGGVARDRDGFGWTFPEGLHALSGFSAVLIHAVGDGGAIYQYDGSTWEKETSPTASALRASTALVSRFGEPFRIYAAGDDGTLIVWKSGAWIQASPPTGAENHRFVDIWAAAIDDVFAVASNATTIVRYDDPYEVADWTLEDTPATSPLLAVGGWRGDVYIASESGEIFFNDGNGWAEMPNPVTTALRDLRALSETSIFAAGDAGVILHFDGTSWKKTVCSFPGTLNAIWGTEGRAAFAVGSEGAVFVYQD